MIFFGVFACCTATAALALPHAPQAVPLFLVFSQAAQLVLVQYGRRANQLGGNVRMSLVISGLSTGGILGATVATLLAQPESLFAVGFIYLAAQVPVLAFVLINLTRQQRYRLPPLLVARSIWAKRSLGVAHLLNSGALNIFPVTAALLGAPALAGVYRILNIVMAPGFHMFVALRSTLIRNAAMGAEQRSNLVIYGLLAAFPVVGALISPALKPLLSFVFPPMELAHWSTITISFVFTGSVLLFYASYALAVGRKVGGRVWIGSAIAFGGTIITATAIIHAPSMLPVFYMGSAAAHTLGALTLLYAQCKRPPNHGPICAM